MVWIQCRGIVLILFYYSYFGFGQNKTGKVLFYVNVILCLEWTISRCLMHTLTRSHNEDFKHMLCKFSPWACGRWRRLRSRPPSAGSQTEQLSPGKHFTFFSQHICLEILSAGWAKNDDPWLFYFYQARVDLLQTSCGPGLGQVWAWLSIHLWNRLSIINSSLESSVSQTSLHSANATMVPGGKSISLSKKSTAWRTSGCKDPPPCTWHLKLGGRKQDDKSAWKWLLKGILCGKKKLKPFLKTRSDQSD